MGQRGHSPASAPTRSPYSKTPGAWRRDLSEEDAEFLLAHATGRQNGMYRPGAGSPPFRSNQPSHSVTIAVGLRAAISVGILDRQDTRNRLHTCSESRGIASGVPSTVCWLPRHVPSQEKRQSPGPHGRTSAWELPVCLRPLLRFCMDHSPRVEVDARRNSAQWIAVLQVGDS